MSATTSTRLWDQGKVYKGNDLIAQVIYALEIVQDIIAGLPQFKITGQVRLLDGERDLVADGILTLCLEDGRQWQFRALDRLGAKVFRVIGASGEGLAARHLPTCRAAPSNG